MKMRLHTKVILFCMLIQASANVRMAPGDLMKTRYAIDSALVKRVRVKRRETSGY